MKYLAMTHPQIGDIGRLHPEAMFGFAGPTICYSDEPDAEQKKKLCADLGIKLISLREHPRAAIAS